MAEGIRIRPKPGLVWPDDAMIVVIDHARPYPPPKDGTPLEQVQPVCAHCKTQHFAKAYHIRLYDGTAIVSTTVWEQFQRLIDNPFEYVNPVAQPPKQHISPGSETRLIEKFAMPILTGRN